MSAPASSTADRVIELSRDWEMVVGLEVHVQLDTRTKAFCNCSAEFGAPVNLNTCPVCLALPGALPVLNAQAVTLAVRAALALGCRINRTSIFARKNYFYPDLPKGYQISQFDKPLATGGHLEIGVDRDGGAVRVGITRVHMEEDAGKSIHDRFPSATAVDLNRAGVPLIEIVSEPDMRGSAEAGAYLRALKSILEFTGVSDVSMEKGSLRVDANVSARRRGESKLGTKTEVKNMNSFTGVERAIESEFVRQCELMEQGGKVVQQTMLWDGSRGEVRPSRAKEQSHDYRYFPEPDLPPLILSDDWIEEQRRTLPELPDARRKRFESEFKLDSRDAQLLTVNIGLADYFEAVTRSTGDARAAFSWVMGEVAASLNASGASISEFSIRPSDLAQLIKMVSDGAVSRSAARTIFSRMESTGKPPAQIAGEEGLLKVGDDDLLNKWISEVLDEHPEEARRFLGGERKLQGVLVGFVMKKSRGSADPKKVNELLGTAAREASGQS
jgi:aspartyl-tRNA(Asn)/glutamyl-tRNA(Gln) amidotransferase subunit B